MDGNPAIDWRYIPMALIDAEKGGTCYLDASQGLSFITSCASTAHLHSIRRSYGDYFVYGIPDTQTGFRRSG